MKKILLLTGTLLMMFSCQKEATKDEVVNYGSSITQEELKEHLYIYASDEFEGRDTGDRLAYDLIYRLKTLKISQITRYPA